MKEHPDTNDTLQTEGLDAVRMRHDRARKYTNGRTQRDGPNIVGEPRIRLIAFNDIQLGTGRHYLVKGLVPRVGLTIVWGPPKSGKSFWTFDVVMHVALNWPYRGRRVHHGAVVYCAFEGQTGIEARCAAFSQRFFAEHRETVPFYLEPVTSRSGEGRARTYRHDPRHARQGEPRRRRA